MREEKGSIIQFEMPSATKFIYYKWPVYSGIWVSGALYIFAVILSCTGNPKHTLSEALSGLAFLPIVMSGCSGVWILLVRLIKLASKLTFNIESKRFSAYIYASKKEVTFTADDIKLIGNKSTMLRFFLKDGTYVSWSKDDKTQHSLNEIINSLGIVVKDMNFT